MRLTRAPWVHLFVALMLSPLPGQANTPAEPAPLPLSVQVTGYAVSGNTLLPAKQVQDLLAKHTGQLSLQDIQQAAQALQAAYREAGYGAVVVQLPEQSLGNGTVQLEVIEGRLSQMQVAGLRAFTRDNILHSLPALQLGTTPRLQALDSELLMANENPAKSVRVVFQPGEKKGDVEALAVVEEASIERWQTSLDNTGNDATGQYRLALNYQHANVMDRDAVLGLRAVTSPTDPSQVAIFSATLRVPLYGYKTFLEWSALASNTRNAPSQTAAGELRFSGEGSSFGARALWTLPSLGEYKHQFSVGAESRRYRNNCTLGSFGAAGCGTAGASVDVFPLTMGYLLQKPGAMQANVQWIANLPIDHAGVDSEFDAARPGALAHYNLLRANAAGITAVTPQWALSWRADMQYSHQALVSAEQTGAGGANSVRGYPERILSGDSGATASLEARTLITPWLRANNPDQNLYLSFYVDAGMVSNQLETACTPGQSRCDIWGSGLGLLWSPSKKTTLRTDVARAGTTVGETLAGSWRLHFNLSHTF
jgi:hemolysin activation/secretion protein